MRAREPFVDRRVGDRRSGQDYPGVERRIGRERRATAARPEQRESLGLFAWMLLALAAALLADALVWQGHYRRVVILAIDAEAGPVREWSNRAWSAVAP